MKKLIRLKKKDHDDMIFNIFDDLTRDVCAEAVDRQVRISQHIYDEIFGKIEPLLTPLPSGLCQKTNAYNIYGLRLNRVTRDTLSCKDRAGRYVSGAILTSTKLFGVSGKYGRVVRTEDISKRSAARVTKYNKWAEDATLKYRKIHESVCVAVRQCKTVKDFHDAFPAWKHLMPITHSDTNAIAVVVDPVLTKAVAKYVKSKKVKG